MQLAGSVVSASVVVDGSVASASVAVDGSVVSASEVVSVVSVSVTTTAPALIWTVLATTTTWSATTVRGVTSSGFCASVVVSGNSVAKLNSNSVSSLPPRGNISDLNKYINIIDNALNICRL